MAKKSPDTPQAMSGDSKDTPLPEDFPCQPLGFNSGTFFILAANGQIQRLAARDLTRNNLVALVSPKDRVLREIWPRFRKDGTLDGFKPELVADAIMRKASQLGAWTPGTKLRGVGCWADSDGNLVVHCGDVLLRPGDSPTRPGLHAGFVYERCAPMPRPAEGSKVDGAVGRVLLDMLAQWNWRVAEVSPQLVLGWIAAALLSGALPWRPMLWVTGTHGTGKSTLQDMVRQLLRDWLVSSSDASAAGIWQRIGCNAQPVALDEIEADESNERSNAIIKLARQASSGGLVLRGGQDHQGAQFTARSAFLFSSIYLPPLRAQDRGRIAVLELLKLRRDSAAPKASAEFMAGLGTRLFRRCMDVWELLPEHRAGWGETLATLGFDRRACDQWGTLLSLGYLMLGDELPDPMARRAIAEFVSAIAGVVRKDDEEASEEGDPEACLLHLATSLVPQWRQGERSTVGACAVATRRYEELSAKNAGGGAKTDAEIAQRALSTVGCRVLKQGKAWFLAVANSHAELGRIYQQTHWATRSGATGVWRQALLRLPGAAAGSEAIRFCGWRSRATLVPIELLGDAGQPAEGEG